MSTNFNLDTFKAEVIETVKEIRKFAAESGKVLEPDDETALLSCIKFMININGDVNHLLQKWPAVNVRLFSLLTRIEYRVEEMQDQTDLIWNQEYVRLGNEGLRDYLAKAAAYTDATYMESVAQTRPYKHLVKLLERSYKLSDNLLRVLEQLSNNMRQENRDNGSS